MGDGHAGRVLVIGGGITGLAAAHALATADPAAEITLLEADTRLGGKILTTPFAGLPAVDAGPDAFLARVREAVALARTLGFDDTELISPATGQASVWWDGRMHPLPEGLVLGVPTGVAALARSRLLSIGGKARAAAEPLLPRRPVDDDLGRAIRSRFGGQILERLVGPLVGGINAGDPDRMSLAVVAPQLADAVARHRSLLFGLRPSRRTTTAGPVFLAPRAGMGALVDRLADALASRGVDVRMGTAASPIEPDGPGWRCGQFAADTVVVAVPAVPAAALLTPVAPEIAADLRHFEAVSVAMLTLAFDETTVPRFDGSGYLVPRHAQRTVTACSWASTKWPHWHRPGQVILRASVGRAGDEHTCDLDDEALLAGVLADLRTHVGLRGEPTHVRITRWPDSMPQYAPGHLGRVADIEARLTRTAPGIHLAGAAYRGIGIPACIRAGQAVARRAAHREPRSVA
jgi:protoporphyrinogen/coproporphyrinogen III oxidase